MKNCLLSFCTIITIITIVFATLPPKTGSGEVRSGAPTFTKDVASILHKSCAECHRPGGIAPMSLIDYKEVRPWAKSIRERVVDRTMPPWFADPKHGEFANDPSLTQAEIDTIMPALRKEMTKIYPRRRSSSKDGRSAFPTWS
jgi:mono/diheme cytochrome c family protein